MDLVGNDVDTLHEGDRTSNGVTYSGEWCGHLAWREKSSSEI
jgi:hypothetical protein